VQFAMVRSIEEHSEEMEAIVAAAAGR